MLARYIDGIAALVAVVVLIWIGYLAGVISSDASGTLYKYQTLAAGMLAVLAALMTVAAMIWADARQGERHVQALGLSIRAEALMIQRAAYFAQTYGKQLVSVHAQLIEQVGAKNGEAAKLLALQRSPSFRIAREYAQSFLADQDIAGARRFVDKSSVDAFGSGTSFARDLANADTVRASVNDWLIIVGNFGSCLRLIGERLAEVEAKHLPPHN